MAGLCLAGMVPKQVRTDWPQRDLAGLVTVDWGDGPDRDKAKRVLVAILLGAMTEGCGGWQEWPIDPQRLPAETRRDAEQARHLAEYIGIADRATWGSTCGGPTSWRGARSSGDWPWRSPTNWSASSC